MISFHKPGEFLLILIIFIAALATPALAGLVLPTNTTVDSATVQAQTLSLPLSFIENHGQAADAVKYQVYADGHSLAFEPDRIVLTTSQVVNNTTQRSNVTMTFPGASTSPGITGTEPLPGKASFFLGSDSSKWQSDLPTYRSIRYQQLYPGIDLRYNGTEGVLKREFAVAAGADLNRIAIAYDGIDGLALTADGSLLINTSLGALTDQAPVAYQEIDGVKVPVNASYRLKDDSTVGFAVGKYDCSRPLIIDPTLLYSSYFGGSNMDCINRVRLDAAGNIYIAGYTLSTDIPLQNANQGSESGGSDAFVTELNPEGTAVLYSTYYGGSGNENAQGLSVDGAGNIYICGGTTSATDLPLQSPFQTAKNGTAAGFVAKIKPSNPPGSQLVFSTYLGSLDSNPGTASTTNTTGAISIVADQSGGAWVSGYTDCTNFPVTADAAQNKTGGWDDAYLARFASDGSLSYATYLGGSLNEGDSYLDSSSSTKCSMGLALDAAGNVYMGGYTKSLASANNFPITAGVFQPICGGNSGATASKYDGFVAKYTSSGSEVYVSYLGGSAADKIYDLAVDAAGAVYVTGFTNSLTAAYGWAGSGSVFLTKIDPSFVSLDYSTKFGGTGSSNPYGITVDGSGDAYVTGYSTSNDFTIMNGTAGATNSGRGFAVKYSPAGTMLYSTCIGLADSTTYFYGIAVNDAGDAVVGGMTQASNYPLTNSALQTTNRAITPYFDTGALSILTNKAVAGFTATPISGNAPLSVQFNDTSAGSPMDWSWDFGDTTTSTEQNPIKNYTSPGIYSVNLTVSNSLGSTHLLKTNYITVLDRPVMPVANFSANVTTGTTPLAVQFNDTSLGENLTNWSWAFGDGNTSTEQNPVNNYTAAGTYTVNLTVTNATGSDNTVKTNFITVTAPLTPTPTVTPAPGGVLPDYTGIYVRAANDGGIRWDTAGNGTYYINNNGGGLNAVHISTDPAVNAGQVTVSPAQSGTFYVTDSGGRGYQDEAVLMLAVNGTLPDDFAVRIKTSGYTWTPSSAAPSSDAYTYQATALDETFNKSDFVYGPQNWKPSGSNSLYPIFYGEDMASSDNQFSLAFIDTRAGLIGSKYTGYASLMNEGAVKVEYTFTNLTDSAAFNIYGWNNNAGGTGKSGMGWTNALTGLTASGYSVTAIPPAPVAGFTANITNGTAPLSVGFTDASTGSPMNWSWSFGDGNTSIEQNPSHTYASTGNYTVNLTATNAGGSNTSVKTNYITVTGSGTPMAPVAGFTANVTSGSLPLTVQFTDASTGSPTAWSWDFNNDGTVDATTQNPTFTYPKHGVYSVNLTVTNSDGTNTTIKSNYITVSGATTWTVGASGCDFTTLMDAMNSASVVDGDTVYVYNGTYIFPSTFSKSIILSGEDANSVTFDLNGNPATLTGTGTIIENVRFTNGLMSFPSQDLNNNFPAKDMIIRNCIFELMKVGWSGSRTTASDITLSGTNNTFSGNIFRNNAVYSLIYMTKGVNIVEINTFT